MARARGWPHHRAMGTDAIEETDQDADAAVGRWFLTVAERRNDATRIDRLPQDAPGRAWSPGNQVRPLIHGAEYFGRLHEELCRLEPGDRVFFTDWSGDGDEQLLPDGAPIGEVLCNLVTKG